MTENLIVKWIVIILLVGAAGWLFWDGRAKAPGDSGPLKLGIDLRGGKAITYSIQKSSLEKVPIEDRAKALDETVETISKRIDALQVKELNVRKLGDDKILIEAPKMTDAQLSRIKEQMLALGQLEFLIGIDEWPASQPLDVPGDRPDEYQRYVFDRNQAETQRKLAYDSGKDLLNHPYRNGEAYTLIDSSRTPARQLPIVWVPDRLEENDPAKAELDKAKAGKQHDATRIRGKWLYKDPHFFGLGKEGFTGQHIKDPHRSNDKIGQRTVQFAVDRFRQDAFAEYTGKYVNKPMALVLNEEHWSSPVIQQELRESVVISNPGGFTATDQDWLVNCLTSGSLRLKPRQESEEEIGAGLGQVAINRGAIASAISGVLILFFMIWYYRVAGIVANVALILNLFFILAVMVLFEATMSLPAIAGIILSMGMGVDANILVFERTREEMQKGKALLPALQAGYQGAFSAIFDGNVTSAITAALMIKFGTGPIRGFGITLLAGLIIQMFTALFVTKAIFGLLIKKGWMTKIHFIDVMKPVNYPWMARAKYWQMGSAVLVLLAIVMFVATGDDKYGLDFTGGTSARMKLAQLTTDDEVRATIDSIKDVAGDKKYPERDVLARTDAPGASANRSTQFDVKLRSIGEVNDAEVRAFVGDHLKHAFGDKFEGIKSVTNTKQGEWRVELAFKEPVGVVETRQRIDNYQDQNKNRPFAGSLIEAIDATTESNAQNPLDVFEPKAKTFTVDVARQDVAAGSAVTDLRAAFAGKLAPEQQFDNVAYLGPNVVASLKESAIVSMIFALAGIVLYVWFRFKEVKYGIAGVAALVHDVLVPLGLMILLHELKILNLPITLPSIAAFLTIIGYQINDTIVVFDRVRENVGRIKGTFREIMDISISQTLSRTILTTTAVFAVILVIFVVNIGQDSPLEGMAFILLIGTVAGSLSTIFIACPIAVWLTERRERRLGSGARQRAPSPTGTPVAAAR